MMRDVSTSTISTSEHGIEASSSKSSKHQIKMLPGVNGVFPSKTYSGFVNVEDDTNLFYVFSESRDDPSKDPVVMYMNGGPGASSLAAFFGANGPLLYVDENEFMVNPYAWNLNASLLAIEFAPGIGYSTCKNSTNENGTLFCPRTERLEGTCSPCLASDSTVAKQNAKALETLFGKIFPELKSRALYISGESYAGTYVPTLAREILSQPEVYPSVQNLKGLWVTDPCMSNKEQFGYLDLGVTFAYVVFERFIFTFFMLQHNDATQSIRILITHTARLNVVRIHTRL